MTTHYDVAARLWEELERLATPAGGPDLFDPGLGGLAGSAGVVDSGVPAGAGGLAGAGGIAGSAVARARVGGSAGPALPDGVVRWLRHAIAPGTPLSASGLLQMHGQIKIGRSWRAFRATQVLAPPHGYVWSAHSRIAGLPVSGFDRYSDAAGEMRWRLMGVVPVMSAAGDEVTRSAAGRMAAEIVLIPTAFRSATWSAGIAEGEIVGRFVVDGRTDEVQLRIDSAGRVQQVQIQRWGAPLGEPFARYPFGVTVSNETTFGGVTIPSQFSAAWFAGTDRQAEGEFFRATVTDAVFH